MRSEDRPTPYRYPTRGDIQYGRAETAPLLFVSEWPGDIYPWSDKLGGSHPPPREVVQRRWKEWTGAAHRLVTERHAK